MRPCEVVCVVYCWKYAPTSVNLRVISVDLRDNQEYRSDRKGEGKSCYQRICAEIELLLRVEIGSCFEDLPRKLLQLVGVGEDCGLEVGAVGQ